MPLDDTSRRPVEVPLISPIDPVEVTPIKIIDDMIELLSPERWGKLRVIEIKDGQIVQLCMIGALHAADNGTGLAAFPLPVDWLKFRTDAAYRVYTRLRKKTRRSIGGWNDQTTTRHDDVINVLVRTRHDFMPLSYRLKAWFSWRR